MAYVKQFDYSVYLYLSALECASCYLNLHVINEDFEGILDFRVLQITFLIKVDMSLCLLIFAFSFIKQLIVWWDYSKTNKVKLFLWWYFETGQNIFPVSFTDDSKIRYFSIKFHVFDSFVFLFLFFLYLFIIEFPMFFFPFS